MPRVSAVVVTHNSREHVARCLTSIRESEHPVDEIIVIDHCSTDGTVDFVRREFTRVCMLSFTDNPGFGEGCNRGCRGGSGDYILFVNPDATIEPACLGRLSHALDAEERLAIAVPKIVLSSEPAVLNSTGLAVNSVGHAWDRGFLERDNGQYERSEHVLAGSGCVLFVRRDVFRELGGFDSSYFLYYEDLDLCWRAWLAGYTVRYVPDAVARHAMKRFDRPARYDHYLDHRNRIRTVLKNMPAPLLRRTLWQMVLFEGASAMNLARRRQWRALWFRLLAVLWNTRHLAGTMKQRARSQTGRVSPEVTGRFLVAGRRPLAPGGRQAGAL